jgi:branched-chain amino acid transport system ATP-binding protein
MASPVNSRASLARQSEGLSVLAIENLTVQFGGVRPLDDVSIQFGEGTCGLIGPNGAGKTTLFNVLSGFVAPVSGRATAWNEDLLELSAFRRARWGLRRTFQQDQVIDELSVWDNVSLALDHTRRSTNRSLHTVEDVLQFVSVDAATTALGRTLTALQRRLVELARALVGSPRLVLLDEPAAGLTDAESAALGQVIRSVPARFDALVVLIDHDMELVASTCDETAVLDFGRLIASGPTAHVLRDPQVMLAYLGREEVA